MFSFWILLLGLVGSITCQKCDQIANEQRFDCYPDYNASQNECIKRGCCWRAPTNATSNINVPYCYFPSDFPNYQVTAFSKQNDGFIYNLTKAKATFRPNEILNLQLKITFETKSSLRVQIYDPNDQRYEVPLINVNKPYQQLKTNLNDDEMDYQIYVTVLPFSLQIFRKSTGLKL